MDSNQTAFDMPVTQTIQCVWKIYATGVWSYEKNATSIITVTQVIAEKLPNRVGTKIAQGLNSEQCLTTLTSKVSLQIDRSFRACSLIFECEGLADYVNQAFRSCSNTGQKRVPFFVTNPTKSALLPAPTGMRGRFTDKGTPGAILGRKAKALKKR